MEQKMKGIQLFSVMILTTVFSIGVYAQDEHAAFVFKDNECNAWNVDLGDGQVVDLVGDRRHAVGQYAGGANAPAPSNGKLSCHGSHGYSMERAVVVKGGGCGFAGFVTDNVTLLVTPGGEFSFNCSFPIAHKEK
jgi:hypothetical protein